MTVEYINMLQDALEFIVESPNKGIFSLPNWFFPFKAVMDCYSIAEHC